VVADSPKFDRDAIIAAGRGVVLAEADAVRAVADRIDRRFASVVEVIMSCTGRVVVSGMGKSGHIARKIAATMASTGTPAFFVHPAEAGHGDLGMITAQDVLIAISNSGETTELLVIVPVLKRRGAKLIAITGNPTSSLARQADICLDASVAREADVLGLAPTASTSAQLAMGDALALAILEARGFSAEDYARSHPSGALGRRLLVRVSDVMHSGEAVPSVRTGTLLVDALLEMSQKGLGMTAVVGKDGELLGLMTDGDLRRALQRGIDVHAVPVDAVMTRNPRTVGPNLLAAEAIKYMEQFRINGFLVLDEKMRPIGAFNMHDLFRAGVV
jgi:arabinose-5-phosphate isomerase